MENIQDWCISRQLWWGHRVPVWYADAFDSEADARRATARHGRHRVRHIQERPRGSSKTWPVAITDHGRSDCPRAARLHQDPDVLDTWFSSWLWPFATMGWPEKTETLAKFYPTTDLVTGPDIIFFWVARMIMAGFEYMGEMPFRNVYFTGIIRDKQGRKMSKSLGNSPDPLDLIAKYGADALRFGVMRCAPLGQDVMFDEKNVELGRNFCTKLWNAARFRQMQGGASEGEINPRCSPATTSGSCCGSTPRSAKSRGARRVPLQRRHRRRSTAFSGASSATGISRPAKPRSTATGSPRAKRTRSR